MDGPVHCTQACSTHERDLPAGSMRRQGQGLPTGLLHASAGGPAGLEVRQPLPSSRDEPLPALASLLSGSTILAATYSSASHSLQLWRHSWQGAGAPVPQAGTFEMGLKRSMPALQTEVRR